jgi:uncharacterized protein YraI
VAKTKKSNDTGVVLPARLNVRAEPNGAILDTIEQGAVVEIVTKKKGWFNIHVGNVSGWVDGSYLAIKEAEKC